MPPAMKILSALHLLLSAWVALSTAAPDWVLETKAAGWQARDSQGEVVFRDRLWILGGWFNSNEAPPRDVWSSSNGRDWTLVTREAPWKHSALSMGIVFQDKMWMMGGWFNGRLPGHSAGHQVWCSTDGAAWQRCRRRLEQRKNRRCRIVAGQEQEQEEQGEEVKAEEAKSQP